MAPAGDRHGALEMVQMEGVVGVVVFVAVGLSVTLVWFICGKIEDGEPPPPTGETGKDGAKSTKGEGAEPEAKGDAPAPKSEKEKTKGLEPPPAPTPKSAKPGDATEVRKGGGGPELKRVGVTGAVAESNPAYQTLMEGSKFEASKKPDTAGEKAPKLDKVAGSNLAYQTIMNESKFEASQKPKVKASGTVQAATARDAPSERPQSMMKTAVEATGGTTKK